MLPGPGTLCSSPKRGAGTSPAVGKAGRGVVGRRHPDPPPPPPHSLILAMPGKEQGVPAVLAPSGRGKVRCWCLVAAPRLS